MENTGLKTILNKIKEYKTILLFGHIRPDGDCLGSQFGLQDIIKTTYPEKSVHVCGQTSDYVSFLGSPEQVPEYVYREALGIVVDTGSIDRISDPNFKLCKEIIKIDHHHPVGTYGDYIWLEVYWPAAAQMIAYFYKCFENELKITAKGATALYTGIVTDTGGFRYRDVSALTLKIAGMLIDLGARPEVIDEKLSLKEPHLKDLKGYVLTHMIREPFGFAYAILDDSIVRKFNVTTEEAASMVSELSGMIGFPVWAIIIQYPTEYRVRLRSLSTGPSIHTVAEKLGGGGHDNAAGLSLNNLDTDLNNLKYAVQHAIEDWQRSK